MAKQNPIRSPENRLRTPALAMVMLAAVLALYWPVTKHDFVGYDDPVYVVEKEMVQKSLTADGIAWAFTGRHASNWHPMTWLSHMLDCQWFGMKPGGHHFMSVLLHGCNAALLLLLLRRMTGSLWRAALVAGLFAIHPVHVESVAWVSERKDVLSLFFGLLTLHAYARHTALNPPLSTLNSPWYWAAFIFFALALMAKPMMVTLPLLMLLLDFWPLKRISNFQYEMRNGQPLDGSSEKIKPRLAWKPCWPLLVEKGPFILLTIGSCVMTIWAQQNAIRSLETIPFTARLSNALVSCVRYIANVAWPTDLAVLYPHPGHWPLWQVAGATLLLLGVTVLFFYKAIKRPHLLVGWLWFLIALVPFIGVVQVGAQAMAGRYMYLPAIGLYILVAWSLSAGRHPAARAATGLLIAAVFVSLAAATRMQLRHWQDSITLFSRAVAVTQDNFIARLNLAMAYTRNGRFDDAAQQYRSMLAMDPASVPANERLAQVLEKMGRDEEAVQHYATVLELDPGQAMARNNLGNILARHGRIADARQLFEEGLKLNPTDAQLHYNLAVLMAEQKNLDGAVTHYLEAIRLNPEYADAHNNLAATLAERGDFRQAETHLREAVRLRPEDAEAHYNLGHILLRLGKPEEAARHRARALEINPDLLRGKN